jgi:hypothetical protein
MDGQAALNLPGARYWFEQRRLDHQNDGPHGPCGSHCLRFFFFFFFFLLQTPVDSRETVEEIIQKVVNL